MKFFLGRYAQKSSVPHPFRVFCEKCGKLRTSTRPFKAAALTALAITGMAALPLAAQTTPATPPAPPQQLQPRQGQVIFSRTIDENGQTTTQSGSAATLPAAEGELA